MERIEGFIDNIRYRSLTRDGWILSLSGWRDEKALVRWRTHAKHHEVQENGWLKVFLDYHLRIGEVTRGTMVPEGQVLHDQRLDETAVGEATTVSLIDAKNPPEWIKDAPPEEIARWLGLEPRSAGLVA